MFSVVIPLRNKRATVADTVASVLAQTFEAWELVIIDDGSTDGSRDALAMFSDPRIRAIAQQHMGPGNARNAGIRAARADWIAFLDADDLWLRDHLAELDRVRAAHPEARLIGTAFSMRARCEGFQPAPAPRATIAEVNFFERVAAGMPPFCASSAAIPRRTFLEQGGFGPAPHGQDYEFFARVQLGSTVAASSKVTAVYRLGTGGISDRTAGTRLGPITGLHDLEPSVATIIALYPAIACPAMRRAAARYIESLYRSRVRRRASIGDLHALRLLSRFQPASTGLVERLIFMAAWLPPGLARTALSLAHRLKRMVRAFAAGTRP